MVRAEQRASVMPESLPQSGTADQPEVSGPLPETSAASWKRQGFSVASFLGVPFMFWHLCFC